MNAVITGASSGIGLATSKLLCEKGWKVYGLSRRKPAFENPDFEYVECDVASWESVRKAKQKIKAKVDLLVPNAGIQIKAQLAESSPEDCDRMMDTNIKGVFLTVKAFLDDMLKRKEGMIVVISSKAGLGPVPDSSVYCATKHAVQGFVKSIRQRCAENNVKVSLICPGGVNTKIRKEARPDYLPPEEIAETVLFIAERKADTVIDQIEIEPLVQTKAGRH